VTDEVIRAQVHGALQDELSWTSWPLRRHLAGKAEQVLSICLVRCASCRITRRSRARAFGEFDFPSKRSVNPRWR